MANIELDGTNKKIKVDSGDLTLDVPGDIILDADGGDITFADGGTNLLKVTNSSSDVVFQPQVDSKDIVFKQYDGTVVATVEDNATFNVPTGKLAINGTAITSTAAELNILDGVTATASELNLIDGVTATTSELNILDGVTATASELNLLDGGTSVGGSITLADADGVVVNDGGTMKTIPASDIKTYAGGGGLVRVGGSASTSAAGTVTLDNVFSSSYRNYKIIGHIRSDQSDYVKWRTRASGSNNDGDQYITLERTHYIKDDGQQASTEYGNHTTTFAYFAYAGIAANGDVTGSYCGFDLTLYNPHTDDNMTRHMITGLITFRNAGSNKLYTSHIAGSATANHNADGIRFEMNAGNVDMHRIDIYGMVNS